MERAFCYRLYPTREQTRLLGRVLEIHRGLYNDALQERKRAWQMNRITLHYPDQASQLKAIRAFDADAAWVNYSSVQQTLRRLQKAYDAFFRRLQADEPAGAPRYKSRQRFRSVAYVYGDGIKLDEEERRLYVQRVGRVRLFLHRALPAEARIQQIVLHQSSSGHWYATLQLALPDDVPGEPVTGEAVGIDVGLESYAALSTGELVPNPRWRRAAEEKVARLQRMRARARRGGRRYWALSRGIARAHERTANQRKDFQHKLSARLAQSHPLIAVEALNVAGLARGMLSKSVSDAGWGQFLGMLGYKVARTGAVLIQVPPHGTSQTCSGCAGAVPKSLADRMHACPHCGLTLSRDVNAARVILSRALACLDTARTGPPCKGFPVS